MSSLLSPPFAEMPTGTQGMHTLVGSNLPMRFWCRGGFEGVIVFMVLTFLCGVGAICDSRVGTRKGVCNLDGGRI